MKQKIIIPKSSAMNTNLIQDRRDFLKSAAALAALAALPMDSAAQQRASSRTPIVVPASAHDVEKLAANELARYLSRLYPEESFPVVQSAKGRSILVGTLKSHPGLRQHLGDNTPVKPESFVVTHAGGVAVVAGADPRGTLYGVYALLEKLGCGFYLSYDALPSPRQGRVSFAGWEMSDAPVVAERVVLNWHNFLSSASTWELEDWQRYIDQCVKMRFNTLMIHAYGNNPIFTFRFNGQEKPVGFLATTREGRDWGTQHVNDVRRLVGGEIFRAPVFGASVALVPEADRVRAAQELMQKVFRYARSRGMHVTFALDVDTDSANPQCIIQTLPESARFAGGDLQLPNPDTPEGYAYFKAQVSQLMELYPEIDRLTVWFRGLKTPWCDLKVEHFPEGWRAEYEAALEKNANVKTSETASGIFALSRIVRAFGKALEEAGRGDVELSGGSWWPWRFVKEADAFFPPEASVIPLDWPDIDKPENYQPAKSGRKIIPILWAHHDDRTYVGRPYTPFENFSGKLRERGVNGYGIIHWTTRPLDLYFKSLSEQVWSATENMPVRDSCSLMAARSFGESAKELGGEYLHRFVTEAPMFGRETGNRFIDQPLVAPDESVAGMRQRLELLARIDDKTLSPDGRSHLAYFRDFEKFMLEFFESHLAYERTEELIKQGAFEEARVEIAKAKPEAVISRFAQAARHGEISLGEEALVISLNLRWLPTIVSARQALGLEPVRIMFAPTRHEPLAQGPGSNTFHMDAERRIWKVMGEKETKAKIVKHGDGYFLQADGPLKLGLGPIMGHKFVAGRYAVKTRPESTGYPTEFHVTNGSLAISVQPGDMGALSAVEIEAVNEKANE
jgi:hypothetical protein